MKKITTTGLCCLILSGVFAAQDIYISTTGDNLNAGTLESPYATLAKATSVVSEDGAVIHVAAGTYVFTETAIIKPFDQTITGVNAATTIFDGNNAVALIDGITEFENSQKLLTINKLAFKNAKYTGNTGVTYGGSAIRMGFKTNLNLDDCYFYKNASVNGGANCLAGAVYFAGNDITVNRSFFEENSNTATGTASPGGAITVQLTTATNGATNAVVKNSTFYKNTSAGRGAAIYFNRLYNTSDTEDDATFVVQNCVFLENVVINTTVGYGAAVMLSSGGANGTTLIKRITMIMTNNTIIDNYTTNAGSPTNQNGVYFEGFMYQAHLANNIIISEKSETGFSLLANQTTSTEYGMNNIIDTKSTQINGADFNADAATKNNAVTATTAAEVGVSKTLSGYPIAGTFSVPYLTFTSGTADNTGVNSYLINTIANPFPAYTPVEYVLQSDIIGTSRIGMRDLGAYELITVFGPPTSVVATPGNTQASVAFTIPESDGGAGILDYAVTSSPGNITATGASSPIIVTGLTNGIEYTFTVTARNSAGDSDPSVASAPVIPDFSTSTQTLTNYSGIIFNNNQGIRISGLNKNDKLNVYNSNGLLIYNDAVNQAEIQIPILRSGIYIISINGKAQKHIYQ